MISVIIATKNRDAALRDISLPSLLKQDTTDFEVIIWDASDSEKSLTVASSFTSRFNSKKVVLKYFKAPRVGSASQRNDAVRSAIGDIYFFIDDDSEVSSDGIKSLDECFNKFPEVMGVGLKVVEVDETTEKKTFIKKRIKEKLYKIIGYKKTRKVHPSGSNKGLTAPSGQAEWLSGCSMAFRKEIFDSMEFNEKLEAFGGYAMAEDVELSHRVFLSYGQPLLVPTEGYVRHHEVPESRGKIGEKRIAMFFYNRYLVMQVSSKRAPIWGRIAFGWNMMRRLTTMALRYGIRDTKKGFSLAIRQILKYKKETRAKKSNEAGYD